MSVDVTTEILINRPCNEVYEYACNPDNAPEWYKNIKSVEWLSQKPVQTSSRVAFVAEFLGKTIKYTYEVTQLKPQEYMFMRMSEGPFPMETSYTWESVGDKKTRMKLRNRGEPTGFSRWVAPFVSMAIRRANKKDLELIKSVLER